MSKTSMYCASEIITNVSMLTSLPQPFLSRNTKTALPVWTTSCMVNWIEQLLAATASSVAVTPETWCPLFVWSGIFQKWPVFTYCTFKGSVTSSSAMELFLSEYCLHEDRGDRIHIPLSMCGSNAPKYAATCQQTASQLLRIERILDLKYKPALEGKAGGRKCTQRICWMRKVRTMHFGKSH